MHKTITILTLLSFIFITTACSQSTNCTKDNSYRIDYFSGGGFTGMERGVTIDCNGWLKKWERKLNSSKTILDSLALSSSAMKNISNAMKDSNIYNYYFNKIANYTTSIVLTNQNKVHTISYSSSEVPADLPNSIKAILIEIEKIK
ncbi:MAG: hypothetical protein Q8K92_23995 [Leadbetterella sp.]|nr:hypothetical protein [Leadbetterella sp.]